jgi:hypothetical protein
MQRLVYDGRMLTSATLTHSFRRSCYEFLLR